MTKPQRRLIAGRAVLMSFEPQPLRGGLHDEKSGDPVKLAVLPHAALSDEADHQPPRAIAGHGVRHQA